MRRSVLHPRFGVAAALALTSAACWSAPDEGTATPTLQVERIVTAEDLGPTCEVAPAEFATWFEDGKPALDGFVTAANSLEPLDTDCEFYVWSWRMFLWLTSNSEDAFVFDRAPFFDLAGQGDLIHNTVDKRAARRIRGAQKHSVTQDGQAGVIGGVLMAQPATVGADGSLVFYAVHVNDVYAYMASGVNGGGLEGIDQFPTTSAERDAITKFAMDTYGVKIEDADSLAMELKSSWVKLGPEDDASTFLTIVADVPKFDKVSDQEWNWDGTSLERSVTLGCVGFHLVGSVAGHPEMVWATFEHERNVPNSDYYVVAKDGQTKKVVNWKPGGAPIESDWRFMDGVSKYQSTNQMHMKTEGKAVVATKDQVISPSNTSRTHPWGNDPVEKFAANNTDIISLNDSIRSQLDARDARRNYLLIGASWTKNGVPGVGEQLPLFAGSRTLANSTMETYMQHKSCFDCHNGGKLKGLSHIFGAIHPLTPPKPR